MRWSRAFIPTLRENPAATESIGHQCLLRAGYARQVAPGVYANLFLAERRGVSYEELEGAVERNAAGLFGW